jgi:hypothetical protein
MLSDVQGALPDRLTVRIFEAVYSDGVFEAFSIPVIPNQDDTLFYLPSNSPEINVLSKGLSVVFSLPLALSRTLK